VWKGGGRERRGLGWCEVKEFPLGGNVEEDESLYVLGI
jgi:hypothetical protein